MKPGWKTATEVSRETMERTDFKLPPAEVHAYAREMKIKILTRKRGVPLFEPSFTDRLVALLQSKGRDWEIERAAKEDPTDEQIAEFERRKEILCKWFRRSKPEAKPKPVETLCYAVQRLNRERFSFQPSGLPRE